jgi:predicted deacetylase
MKPSLPISFHDLSSLTLSSVKEIYPELQRAGLQNITWAVIPNHKGQGFSQDLLGFVEQQNKAGDEFYLHGLTHQANIKLKRKWPAQLLQKITNFEAEFAGLNKHDTRVLLHQGLKLWPKHILGIPSGFTAPTWHANPYLQNTVLSEGMTTYEGRFFLKSLSSAGSKSHYCLPLSFAGIPGGISFWKKTVHLLLACKIPFRVVLHPHDFETPTQKQHTLELIRTLSRIYTLKPQMDFLS